jgi:hypothetical protein
VERKCMELPAMLDGAKQFLDRGEGIVINAR